MKEITIQHKDELAVQDFRDKVVSLEKKLLNIDHPDVVKGNSNTFPLTHSFSEGIYIREMSMLKGGIVIGKIHNKNHTWFLMKGRLKIANEKGSVVYNAPTYVNASAGEKRVILALEDSVFINIHPNPDNITNIEQLEKMLTCKNYKAYEKYNKINNSL